MTKIKALKFEQALSRLEEMVDKLEKGDLSLDDSIRIFEEGMELTKFCEGKLTEAEGKIEMLLKGNAIPMEAKDETSSEEKGE